MINQDLTIELVDNAAGFAALRDEWTELLASSRSDCVFLTWEWLHTWWKHFGHDRRLFLVTIRTGSQLIAIAPLTSRRAWVGPLAVPVLEFAGVGTIGSDYLDVIVRRDFETAGLAAIGEFLAERATSLRLPRISESSALAPSLATALSQRGWESVTVPAEVCPFIDLSGKTFDDYLGSVGSSHRYNFKRRLKNLMRDYDVSIEYAQSDDDRRQALEQVVSLHLQRWTPRGGSDAFEGAGLWQFHDELSELARDRGWLRLMVITLDGKPAAAFYGFRYRDRFIFYQSGFDPAFVRSSVGLVMIGLTIRDAIAEGATEYDMLHGDESYKFLWTKTVRQLVRLEMYPPGQIGRMHHRAVRVTAATRKLAKRLLRPQRPATLAAETR